MNLDRIAVRSAELLPRRSDVSQRKVDFTVADDGAKNLTVNHELKVASTPQLQELLSTDEIRNIHETFFVDSSDNLPSRQGVNNKGGVYDMRGQLSKSDAKGISGAMLDILG